MDEKGSWGELVRLVRGYAIRNFGRDLMAVELFLDGGVAARLPVPPWHAGTPAPEPAKEEEFAWPGLGLFRLCPAQARAVRTLFDALIDGQPDVDQRVLLRRAGRQELRRLEALFEGSPAWGTLVVPSPGKTGCYRLPKLRATG